MLNSLADLVLPDGNILELDEINLESNSVVLKVHTRLPTPAYCPLCQQPSQREHSRYDRTVADLAVTGKRLQLKLEVRRLFCDNANCKRCTFAERFPTFLNPYARKTQRLAFQ
jgi:transposase